MITCGEHRRPRHVFIVDVCTLCGIPRVGTPARSRWAFWRYVDKLGPIKKSSLGRCWIWKGATRKDGYGLGTIDGVLGLAHRHAWSLLRGELPAKPLELDHLCVTANCVNPFHLEPVTKRENHRRRRLPFCKRGHRQKEINRYTQPKTGHSRCKLCVQQYAKEQRERRYA